MVKNLGNMFNGISIICLLFHLSLCHVSCSCSRLLFCNPVPVALIRQNALSFSSSSSRPMRASVRLTPFVQLRSPSSGSENSNDAHVDLTERHISSIQSWLEDLYDSVDYEAALTRAGVLTEAGQQDAEMESEAFDGFDDIADEESYADDIGDEDTAIDGQCEGKEGELTYGEMDLGYFINLIRRVNPPSSAKFVDLGSGRGQLVLAAAKLRPFRLCAGIEIVPEVFEIGRGALEIAMKHSTTDLSPCEFFLADIHNFTEPLKDADLIFVYATCFPTSDGVTLSKLSKTLCQCVNKGCIIITINKRLDEELGFQLLEELEGPNPDSVTSPAIAYVWRFKG